MINVNEYQRFCETTAIYPYDQSNVEIISAMYSALGLAGEAGEVAGKVKKWHRDNVLDKHAMKRELGDCLWYIADLCTIFGWTIEEVMIENIDKLMDRKDRNALGGSGDNR